MRAGFASGCRSIVTSGASPWDDTKVFKCRASPSGRAVATIASQGRWNMRDGLPLSRTVVVTLPATSRDYPVVCKEGRHPIRGAVTTITIQCSWQMICRLKRGDDAPSRRVTLKALLWSASKQPLQVTTFTFDLPMTAA